MFFTLANCFLPYLVLLSSKTKKKKTFKMHLSKSVSDSAGSKEGAAPDASIVDLPARPERTK